VTDTERLNDVVERLFCWGYLSHYRDAEDDMTWLLKKLREQDARIAELEARLRRYDWIYLLP
jgi:hypothetical protein